jgi:hypothetical protein
VAPTASGSSSSLHPSGSGGLGGGSPGDKGPDYVYFERKPGQFSEATNGKATAAKMKLELYYKEAVEGVVGRKERCVSATYLSTVYIIPYIVAAGCMLSIGLGVEEGGSGS